MGQRAEWIALGLCRSCGGKKRCGTYCDDCRNHYNTLARERYQCGKHKRSLAADAAYGRRRRKRLRAQGLCVQCSSPSRSRSRCMECAAFKNSRRNRDRAIEREIQKLLRERGLSLSRKG
jgi:hypothetical protein